MTGKSTDSSDQKEENNRFRWSSRLFDGKMCLKEASKKEGESRVGGKSASMAGSRKSS